MSTPWSISSSISTKNTKVSSFTFSHAVGVEKDVEVGAVKVFY